MPAATSLRIMICAGQQRLARWAPLAPVGNGIAVRRRAHLPELRLELEQRLQILLGNPLVGELGRDGVQAFEPERELVLALGAMPARLPKRLQRGADAIYGGRERAHVAIPSRPGGSLSKRAHRQHATRG
jgi:hypothetical protein